MKKKYLIFILLITSTLIFSGCSSGGVYSLMGNSGEVITKSYNQYTNDNGFNYLNNIDKTLNPNTATNFIICPTTKNVYLNVLKIKSDNSPVKIELYENPTITNNGTQFNFISLNRRLNITQTSKTYLEATTSNNGASLLTSYIIGSNNLKDISRFDLMGNLILNKNYCYMIKITNQASTINHIIGQLGMYEE